MFELGKNVVTWRGPPLFLYFKMQGVLVFSSCVCVFVSL